MDTNTPKTESETLEERERLLSQLDAKGRKLIEDLLIQHPGLTAAEAIQHCEEMGGL